MACLAPLVFPGSDRHVVFSFYTGRLPVAFYLHIASGVILFFFSVQICQIQSLFSKYCDLVLKRIISLYCFRRVVYNFQTGILKESTKKIFWEQGRESFAHRIVNIFLGKRTQRIRVCDCVPYAFQGRLMFQWWCKLIFSARVKSFSLKCLVITQVGQRNKLWALLLFGTALVWMKAWVAAANCQISTYNRRVLFRSY